MPCGDDMPCDGDARAAPKKRSGGTAVRRGELARFWDEQFQPGSVKIILAPTGGF